MRLQLKTINNELAKRGYAARLIRADGYFCFDLGEAADWLHSIVDVQTVNSLTLKQWMREFHRLKDLNERAIRALWPQGAPPPADRDAQTEA